MEWIYYFLCFLRVGNQSKRQRQFSKWRVRAFQTTGTSTREMSFSLIFACSYLSISFADHTVKFCRSNFEFLLSAYANERKPSFHRLDIHITIYETICLAEFPLLLEIAIFPSTVTNLYININSYCIKYSMKRCNKVVYRNNTNSCCRSFNKYNKKLFINEYHWRKLSVYN